MLEVAAVGAGRGSACERLFRGCQWLGSRFEETAAPPGVRWIADDLKHFLRVTMYLFLFVSPPRPTLPASS